MQSTEEIITTIGGGTGDGISRLVRASRHLVNDDDVDPMKTALRVAIEQLFRCDSPLRRECLSFAADQLEGARSRWQVRTANDEMLIDLLRAACLARIGQERRARALVDECRERANRILHRRWQELERLDGSDDPVARARGATLRREMPQVVEELEAIAADAQDSASPTDPANPN